MLIKTLLPFQGSSITALLFALLITGCASADSSVEAGGSDAPKDQNCLEIILTGTMGGPANYDGLAGSGTLVKYGSEANNCGDIHLQFDAGRATSLRLSELGVGVNKLDAIFITHLHSDHTVGLVDILQTRWHFFGKPVDLICSADQVADKPLARTMSCANYAEHIADAAIHGGEIAQRSGESNKRNASGPASIVNHISVVPNSAEASVVWQSGVVRVSAIGSRHIPGHLSYRVDTPQGSVVIGGDAGNDIPRPPRPNSTSAAVERLAQGADVLVHSTMHPVFGPEQGSSFPAPLFHRQSTAGDLGGLAKRAGVEYLMLTHLIPTLDAVSHGPYKVPGGPLGESDYVDAARAGGFQGDVFVGRDKLKLRLPRHNR